jgi:hypothetical protein
MSTACWPLAVSLRITPAGYPRAAPSSFPPKGAQSCLPRQVYRRTQDCLSCGHTPVPRTSLTAAEPRAFASWLRLLFRHDWVVYSKRPFGGPEHVLRYLGAYTHRVAISNSRLVALSEGNVTFRWRDSAHGNKKRIMTLAVEEFLRRFLLHLFPRGFVRIRNFGFLANRQRAELLPLCFQLLQAPDRASAGGIAFRSSPFARCGNVRFAAEPCTLSNASPPRNSCSDLHLNSAGAQHESTSPASNLARASARTLVLCLAFVRMQYGGAIQTLRCAAPRPFSLRPATETQALSPQRQTRKRSRPAHPDTNPIVPRGGFLQVAVSEAPLHSVSTPSSSLVGASDTALRLQRLTVTCGDSRPRLSIERSSIGFS